MVKNKGITLIALTITIVIMMILAGITTYFGKDLIKQVKLQDLRTNMLLIQAKAREYLEETTFQKITNLEEAKNQGIIRGTAISGTEVQSIAEKTGKITAPIEQYYYLTAEDLNEMGIEELKVEEYGYFIIRYDLDEIKVEVLNTNGYQGNYTLDEINSLVEE